MLKDLRYYGQLFLHRLNVDHLLIVILEVFIEKGQNVIHRSTFLTITVDQRYQDVVIDPVRVQAMRHQSHLLEGEPQFLVGVLALRGEDLCLETVHFNETSDRLNRVDLKRIVDEKFVQETLDFGLSKTVHVLHERIEQVLQCLVRSVGENDRIHQSDENLFVEMPEWIVDGTVVVLEQVGDATNNETDVIALLRR